MLNAAGKEKEKLDRLSRVDRYILVFSADGKPGTKDKIREMLSPYVLRNEDIVFAADLNNYLAREPEVYQKVLGNYLKLWIQNADALKEVLFEAVNGSMISRSEISWDDAVEKARVFVETDVYIRALKKLRTNRALIISGAPGVGKTTLAEQLGLYFCARCGFSHYLYISNMENLHASMGLPGKKVLIITTREYILEQGLEQNEDFRRFVEQHKIDFRMEEYGKADRLRIYLGHLKNSSLTWNQLQAMSSAGEEVIYSHNYIPRLISDFLRTVTSDMKPEACVREFRKYLKNPEEFWSSIYHNLSPEARKIFLILALLPHPVELALVKECYDALLAEDDRKLERKEFGSIIMELEKTVIRTEDYSEIEKGLMTVSYQNPSVKDFIQGYIEENLEQCRDILYQSCLYFEQCLEYLQILGQVCCPADLYAQVMNRAIELEDTDNIDFFRTYRKAERKGGDAYFQRAAGSISRIGRSLQLISLYRKESCGTLEAFMQAKLDTARRTMKRNAEVLLETDMALFPKAAASAVREGLCADGEELLEEYLDCLMRLRLPLDDEELENVWDGQWTVYKSENIKRLGEYLRTYYYAEMCLAAVRQVYDYIKDSCGLTEQKMREVFFSLDIETHREGLWSEKELSGALPEFWEWQEEKRQALVQRKIFVKRWNYWHLTNRAFVMCVFIKELWELPEKERKKLFHSIYCPDSDMSVEKYRIPWAERMTALGRYLSKYILEAENLILSVFLETDPDSFCQDLLKPLAVSLWERIRRPSEQESVHALLEELNLELTAEDDGALYVSSMSMDNYLSVRGILDGYDLMDQIFPQLSKEQMDGLKEKGLLQEDSGEIKASSLDDSFLKELGMYDVLTELLRDICLRAGWEEEQDG